MPEAAATSLAIPEGARCAGCGYALRGLTTPTCPECGRGFDPGDAGTMWTSGTRWSHRGMSLLNFLAGWPAIMFATAGTLLTLWVNSMPPVRFLASYWVYYPYYHKVYWPLGLAARATQWCWAVAAVLT